MVTAETPRHEQADAKAAGEPQADAYAEGTDSWYGTAARSTNASLSYVLPMPFLRACATKGVGACVVLWRLSVGTRVVTDTVVVNELGNVLASAVGPTLSLWQKDVQLLPDGRAHDDPQER